MAAPQTIHIVECHAEGEVGDVVVAGVEPPPGDTLWAQSRFIANDRGLKDFLLNEPRGGVFCHANLLVPPKHPDADAAFIIMEPETVPPMSGSNTMCVATVLLETGVIPMREPGTTLKLEAPGGLIDVVAHCRDGRVIGVTLTNIASFADRLGASLEVEAGTVAADIVFGGDSFVIVDAATLGFALTTDEARDLTVQGMKIARLAQEQIGFSHPDLPGMNEITFCLFAGPIEYEGGRRVTRHAVAIKPGKLDRSPTGTGCSARLALMHARGEAAVGDEITFRSVLGSAFTARIESETTVGGRKAIRPSVTGRAFIMGARQLTVASDDPWPTGYRLVDTWPGAS
jgi:proline racemase